MQAIDLSENWCVSITSATEASASIINLDDFVWLPVHLPLKDFPTSEKTPLVWLQCTFEMEPNDECSSWWLELDIAIDGELWVNGDYISRLDEIDPPQIEITNAVAVGENFIFIRAAKAGLSGWQKAVCVPYPCA